MLIVIALVFLYMSAPDTVGEMLNTFLRNQAGDNNLIEPTELINVSFIGSL